MKKTLLFVFSFLFTFSLALHAQYTGTGSFGKISSMDDFEADTYYVLHGINGDDNGAMGSSFASSGRFEAVSVTIASGTIVDPATAIVWKVAGDATNGYTLYNENTNEFCEITGDNTSGFSLEASALEGFDASYDDDDGFIFSTRNAAGNNRKIAIYKTDFRSYTNPNTLHLYKLGHVPPPPTGTLELTSPNGGESYSSGQQVQFAWNSTDVSSVDFQVWNDDSTWETIVEDVASVDGANTYDFTIPANAWSWNGYKIKVVDASESSINDESDATFSIDGHDSELLWTDFDSDLAPWTAISVDASGSEEWSSNDYNGKTHAYINGYDSGENEDWLISTAINMDNTSNETLEFVSASKFGDNAGLSVKYSTDYDGGGDPSSATWIDLSGFTLGDGTDSWINSGTVSLSSISGNAYIAFVYACGTSDAVRWRLTNIYISGVDSTPTNLYSETKTDVTITPNPFVNELRIESTKNVQNIVMFNTTGQVVKNDNSGIKRIITHNLPKGMYILQVKFADGSITTKKVIKK